MSVVKEHQAPIEMPPPARHDLYHFLRRKIAQIRWATLGALLVIMLAWPPTGGGPMPAWTLVALFAVYNLLVGLLRNQPPGMRVFSLVAVLDLLVGSLLYVLAAEFGGPLFVLFFFAVDSAAATMSLRGTLLYAAAVAAVAVAGDLTILGWAPTTADLRMLGTRLVMLALVAAGMALLTRRLTMEHAEAHVSRDEAQRLEELDRLRADFIATVSHDLRTPLTAARTALRLVERSAAERLHPEERALLHNGHRNTERLSLLIDDLLALNQITAGIVRLECAPLDLRTVVAGAVAGLEPLVRDKGQTVVADLPDPLPCEGDRWRLEQMLVNVLANGHQHTPAGSHLAVQGRVTDGEVRLTVSDNGPGIPASEHEAIFRRFYRLSPATGMADGDCGLGLAIAKGLIELHGGRIWVESEPGHGATFTIALPRAGRAREGAAS